MCGDVVCVCAHDVSECQDAMFSRRIQRPADIWQRVTTVNDDGGQKTFPLRAVKARVAMMNVHITVVR